MDKRNNKRKYFNNINVSVFQIHTQELILIFNRLYNFYRSLIHVEM